MKQAKLLTREEWKRLHAVIDAHRHATRNRTAFALGFYAGLRACEICTVRIEDVFDIDGHVRDVIQLDSSQTKGAEANSVFSDSQV